ncbi:unnamed protein product, partial [Discosporangium mesarthrocarpum]
AEEFTERFVRRDMVLAGRVRVVEILSQSDNATLSRLVCCGGFRVIYKWLCDAWERAGGGVGSGDPDWAGIGGMPYVEGLLAVLSRLPMSVDMLRET